MNELKEELWCPVSSLRDVRDCARALNELKSVDSSTKGKLFEKMGKEVKKGTQTTILKGLTILGLAITEELFIKKRPPIRLTIWRQTPATRELGRIMDTEMGKELSEGEKDFFRKLLFNYSPTERALLFFKRYPGDKSKERLAKEIFSRWIEKKKIGTLDQRAEAFRSILKDAGFLTEQWKLTDAAWALLFPPEKVATILERRFEELGFSTERLRGMLAYVTTYKVPVIGKQWFVFLYCLEKADVESKVVEATHALPKGVKPAAVVSVVPGVERSYTEEFSIDSENTIPLYLVDIDEILHASGQPILLSDLRNAVRKSLNFGVGTILKTLETKRNEPLQLSQICAQTEMPEPILRPQLCEEMWKFGFIKWFIHKSPSGDINVFQIDDNGKRLLKLLNELQELTSEVQAKGLKQNGSVSHLGANNHS